MTDRGFPDDKAFPIFAEGLQELIKGFKYYTQKVSEVSPNIGDLHILTHLFTAVFINTSRDYIDFYRKEKNDPPSEGVKCYMQLVKLINKSLTDDMIIKVFKYPPEEWANVMTTKQ